MNTVFKFSSEIGSEFWTFPKTEINNRKFPESTQWFLSGRSALLAIISELKQCQTIAMPSWCCDSMVKPFVEAGLKVCFYSVYFDNGLIQDINFDCDVLFLIDYFGYTGQHVNLKNYKGVVIRDVTHSIFSDMHTDADYYFGSLRKWCGVWTGGYAWKKNTQKIDVEFSTNDFGYIALRNQAMRLKSTYISSPNKAGIDKPYLGIFNEAEKILENIGVVSASDRDVTAAHMLDIEYIKTRRRANAEILRRAFSDWLIFPEMSDHDCPLFVPVLVPDGKRDELRRYLIKHEIYCPVHWRVSEYHEFDDKTERIYMDELSLICDQRYTEEDMNRIVDTINAFWKDGT